MVGSTLWWTIVLLFLGKATVASSPKDKQTDLHVGDGRPGGYVHDEQALVLFEASVKQHKGLLDKPTSVLSASLTAERSPPHNTNEDWSGPTRGHEPRVLQTTCNVGDPFAITSSAFPLIEGCFSDMGFVTEDGNVVYESSPFAVASLEIFNSTSNETLGSLWYVLELATDGSIAEFYCISAEDSTALPHPADATWICDLDGDGQFDLATSSDFSSTCSCSATTQATSEMDTITTTTSTYTTTDIDTTTTTADIDTPSPTMAILNPTMNATSGAHAPTPSPSFSSLSNFATTTTPVATPSTDSNATITTTDVESVTCDEGASFTISSTLVPDAAGCYFDTGSVEEGEIVYTETGTIVLGQNAVFASILQGNSTDIRWFVGFVASPNTTDEAVLYCHSLDQATDVHPVDVEQWLCTSDSANDTELATTEDFLISCGCFSDAEEDGLEADIGHLSAPLQTLITFGVGIIATAIVLAGI